MTETDKQRKSNNILSSGILQIFMNVIQENFLSILVHVLGPGRECFPFGRLFFPTIAFSRLPDFLPTLESSYILHPPVKWLIL